MEDATAVATEPGMRAARRKKAVKESPSPRKSTRVVLSENAAKPKKTKKTVDPTPNTAGMDIPAAEQRSSSRRKKQSIYAEEGSPAAKSPRWKQQSVCTDWQENAELIGPSSSTSSLTPSSSTGTSKTPTRKKRAEISSAEPEVELELMGSSPSTSSRGPSLSISTSKTSSQRKKAESRTVDAGEKVELMDSCPLPAATSLLTPSSAGIGNSKTSIRKKRASASNLQQEPEVASLATDNGTRDVKSSTEEGALVIGNVGEMQDTLAKKPRRKKVSSLMALEDMSANMAMETMQDKQAEAKVLVSSEHQTQEETAKPSRGRKRQPTKRESIAKSLIGTVASVDRLSLGSEITFPPLREGEPESNNSGEVDVATGGQQVWTHSSTAFSMKSSSLGSETAVHTLKQVGAESESSGKLALTDNSQKNWMQSRTISSVRKPALISEASVPSLKDVEDVDMHLGELDLPRDIEQDSTVSRTMPLQNAGFASQKRRMGTSTNSFSGQRHVVQQRRAPLKALGFSRSKVFRSSRERRESNSQQWAKWNNSRYDAGETAAWRDESSLRKQSRRASHQESGLRQGYGLANMGRAHGLERKKRKEFSLRNVVANQASTLSYIQIFGTGFDTGDTVPTVLLFFDRRRFLFNVGEGFHRFSMEHKFKLSKIDHVFLTRVCTETAGGLPGLILTLAEMNEAGFTVKTWGPSSLDDLAQAARLFVPSGWMEHAHSFGSAISDYALSSSSLPILLLEDELLKISAVLLYSEDTSHSNTGYVYSADERNARMLSTVYICELSTVRGKFDPEKARSKGLKPGYKYGKLQRGESVLSDDGTTMVHPEDVLGPSSPGPIVLLVDCPSTSYISSLISSTSLQSFFPETGKVVNSMIHIGPASVTSSKDYQAWMENFRETDHIMARREVKVLGMPTLMSSAKVRSKLNVVCPWLFPLVELDAENEKDAASGRVVMGKNLLKYHLRPLADLGLDTSEVPQAFNCNASQEGWDLDVIKARDIAHLVWKRWLERKSSSSSSLHTGYRDGQSLPTCLHNVSREEMELVFLGTGSSQPSKFRNVTGIYIHLFKKGGILLDCGEGTFAQLKRRYGAKGADDVLMSLKCIWISHMHADHFLGIGRILSARRELLQSHSMSKPILVIGPKMLKLFLDAYGKVEDLMMEFLDCSQTTLEVQRWVDNKNAEDGNYRRGGLIHGSAGGASNRSGMQHVWKLPGYHISRGIDMEGRKRLRNVLDSLGLKDLVSVPVIHCPHAFAVVLEAQGREISENAVDPGWKLVFSGDTRPCQALVDAAQGATILIHEATFEDALVAEAVKKNHSITEEAIHVGVHAGVYRIFLTHFSQRYPNIPSFDNCFHDRTCIAFDMMSVNLADLPLVPEFLPALQMLFKDQPDAEEDADEKTLFSV